MRRPMPNGASGNGDPFRQYLAKALQELLAASERADRRWEEQEKRWEEQGKRWEEQEKRWEEQELRWKADRLERAEEHEIYAALFENLGRRIDESTRLTVASLKEILVELKSLRRRSGNGSNGR